MVVQRDYIMRMVEKLADTFQQLVAEGSGDDYESLDRIDRSLAEAFRARPETLHLQIDQEIDDLDGRMAAEVGRLCALRTRIADRLGRADLSERSLDFALRSLVEAADQQFHSGESSPAELLVELLRREETTEVMSADEMAEAWRVVFEAEAERQNFPRAEDALFASLALADWPEALVRRGIRFYERLAELPEELLERRGLPPAEVAEALGELRERLG